MKENRVPFDRRVYNSIIDTLGKSGQLHEARGVFENMQRDDIKPDITTWNSLIRWHCQAGDVGKALEFFSTMQDQGLYPDPKIFVIIISRLGEE
ncbi:Tetratricopeptide repeat (TPR)-like superfamily protein, partial [Thalictrum thalictroides]